MDFTIQTVNYIYDKLFSSEMASLYQLFNTVDCRYTIFSKHKCVAHENCLAN